jgi:esterase/lipase superfamily enzyme
MKFKRRYLIIFHILLGICAPQYSSAKWDSSEDTSIHQIAQVTSQALDVASLRPTPSFTTKRVILFFYTNRAVTRDAEEHSRTSRTAFIYSDMFSNKLGIGADFGTIDIMVPTNRRRGATSLNASKAEGDYFSPKRPNFIQFPAELAFNINNASEDITTRPLLYIHGINNSFISTARRAAQLALDLGKSRPMLFFSWPSDMGRNILFGSWSETLAAYSTYDSAKPVSGYSIKHLSALLTLLEGATKRGFDLLGHSMGAELLVNSLLPLDEASRPQNFSPSTVILAAADISLKDFRENKLPVLVSKKYNALSYCSLDAILAFSEAHNSSDERLGYCGTRRPLLSGLEQVQILGNFNQFAFHAEFLNSIPIVNDFARILTVQPDDTIAFHVPAEGRSRSLRVLSQVNPSR